MKITNPGKIKNLEDINEESSDNDDYADAKNIDFEQKRTQLKAHDTLQSPAFGNCNLLSLKKLSSKDTLNVVRKTSADDPKRFVSFS